MTMQKLVERASRLLDVGREQARRLLYRSGREQARRLLYVGLLFAPCTLSAASTLRLVYGKDWSPAGRAVKATLSSAEFRSASKGKYLTDFVDEEGGKQAEKNIGSLKLPALFMISEGGNCYCVIEGVKSGTSAKQFLAMAQKMDARRLAAEREGFDTADKCGAFLEKMEKFVGGPRRIIAKGFYDEIFAKLKKLDPNDETGWVRHFTLGEEFDRNTKADGLELVIKANWYREKDNLSEGGAFIEREMKKPRQHLSKEQIQGLLMAKFALYRDDSTRAEEMDKILTRIAEFDETTFWGTAAVGWLNVRGKPPLSTYWGWRKGDFKGTKLAKAVKYGVDCSFPKAGHYTITFARDAGSSELLKFDSLQLMAGKEEVALLNKPQVAGNETTFEVDVKREYRGRINAMVVRGSAGAEGDSTGKITIHRRVLKPRKELTSGQAPSLGMSKETALVASYIAKTVGKDALADIAKREGGAAFLKSFFGDAAWMESFAGSGMWDIAPWKGLKDDPACALMALRALDLLVWNDKDDFIGTKLGRNIATALALDHGKDWNEEKLVRVMECYRDWAKDGTLVDTVQQYDVRKWREVLGFGQNAGQPVDDLIWIHDFANFAPERYYGLCWCCAYRDHNCFGDDVQGPHYYRPWQHRWKMQEMRYRVGGVCGALSKFGSFGAASHGIRSFTAGQPGHCAYLLWDYPNDIWGIAYAVTAHTGPHNSLGSYGFAAVQEQNRYYLNPKRMDAERLRWKGDYADAMAACPGNYQAGVAWYQKLEAKNAPQAEWDEFGDAVAATFNGSPSQGWVLYLAYLNKLGGKDAKLAAAKKALASIREADVKSFENPYWDEIALNPLDKMFPNDDEAMWQVFETALDGQAKTPSFWRQTVSWGSGRLMKKDSKRYLKTVGASALKSGEKLDFSDMIRQASDAEDITMWRQVYTLMDKISPKAGPKATGKGWPKDQYGGTLLSQDGLLKISNTSQWDNPVNYRCALTASDFDAGNAFHTGKNNAPWGMVVLPGSSDIAGITVVNTPGQNAGRQAPLRIWLSDDGKEWSQVFAADEVKDEWKCQLPAPVKAKYIKVGRENDPSSSEHLFHLRKILVYGKKLY